MKTRYLDNREKYYGRKKFYSYAFYNGLGWNFLGQTPVYLMAIHFGANNYQLSYISSIVFVSGFFLLIMPYMFNGKDMIKVQTRAWFIRGFVSLLYGLLLFLDGQPAIYLILFVYTVFCLMRMIGITYQQPIMRMISSNRSRGYTVSQTTVSFQLGSLISQIISFLFTSFPALSGLYGLLGIQTMGVGANTLAARSLKHIPSREKIEYKKGYNPFKTLGETLKDSSLRYLLVLQVSGLLIAIFMGLIIPMLKKDSGFDSSLIFLFTLVYTCANLCVSYLIRSFADITGNRPFLIFSAAGLLASTLLWVIIPLGKTPAPLIFILGFISFFFFTSLNTMIPREIIETVSEEQKVPFNTMLQFVIAFFALIFSVLAGFLVTLGESFRGADFQHSYWIIYLTASLLTLIILVYTIRHGSRENSNCYRVRDMLKLFFSFGDISVYRDISRMRKESNLTKRKILLNHISLNKTRTATSEIHQILLHPLHEHRAEAIRGLFLIPRPELQKPLEKIAENPDDNLREDAIFALGAYKNREARDCLFTIYSNSKGIIRAQAAKSLGRINRGGITQDDIYRDLEQAADIKEKLNLFIGLHRLEEGTNWFKAVNLPAYREESDHGKMVLLSLMSTFIGEEPPLNFFYHLEEREKGRGFRNFLEDARDFAPFDEDWETLHSCIEEERFEDLIGWIQGRIQTICPQNIPAGIPRVLLEFSPEGAGRVTGLGFLYFFYHTLHESVT